MRPLVALGILLALVAAVPTAEAEVCKGSGGNGDVDIDTQGGLIIYYPNPSGGGSYIAYTSHCP